MIIELVNSVVDGKEKELLSEVCWPSDKMSRQPTAANSVDGSDPFLEHWGFTLRDLYNLALKFFKGKFFKKLIDYIFERGYVRNNFSVFLSSTDKEGKAMHFTYQERLQLVALTCQVSHGKFQPSTAPPLGVLDVIGKDRRFALFMRWNLSWDMFNV